MSAETYGDAYSFLRLHTDLAELADPDGPGRVLVAPDLAGRVMTSTTAGPGGASWGWLNRKAFVSPPDRHFTNYGAEERLWLGPEGGQFSLYFAPGAEFELRNWYVPREFNQAPLAVVSRSSDEIAMCAKLELRNWSGTSFTVRCERAVRIIPRARIASELSTELPAKVTAVGYETENAIVNLGDPMRREKGLLSIWLLGMLNASPATVVLVPFRTDAEGGAGPVVNDAYFGKIPPGRLAVTEKCIAFRADAAHRGKIGVRAARCTGRIGSLDAESGMLTALTYDFAPTADYVNSAWEIQDDPYGGDAVNSYNDGPPPGGGEGLGSFYELESSSPARELEPGARTEHRQRTFHFQGSAAAVKALAEELLCAGAAAAFSPCGGPS